MSIESELFNEVEGVKTADELDVEMPEVSGVERLDVTTETVFNEVEKTETAEDEVINAIIGVSGIVTDAERVESDEVDAINRLEVFDVEKLEVPEVERLDEGFEPCNAKNDTTGIIAGLEPDSDEDVEAIHRLEEFVDFDADQVGIEKVHTSDEADCPEEIVDVVGVTKSVVDVIVEVVVAE